MKRHFFALKIYGINFAEHIPPILYVFYNSYRYVQTWAPISVWTLDNFKELYGVSDFNVVLEYVCIYRNRCDRQPAFSYYGHMRSQSSFRRSLPDIYDGSVSATLADKYSDGYIRQKNLHELNSTARFLCSENMIYAVRYYHRHVFIYVPCILTVFLLPVP